MITLERARKRDIPMLYGLYLRAFPPSERKPFGIILRMAREGRTDLWVIRRRGRFAGLASTVNSPDLVLLDYFAVCRHLRGQGVGTAALREILEWYAPGGVLVEIESTRAECSNRTERLNRKKFYVNCGMTSLDTQADLFGVRMELLGCRCSLDFAGYKEFYVRYYTPRAAKYVRPVQEEP